MVPLTTAALIRCCVGVDRGVNEDDDVDELSDPADAGDDVGITIFRHRFSKSFARRLSLASSVFLRRSFIVLPIREA